MDIIVLLIVGLIVGALGRAVVPGKQSMPIWLTLIIGVGSLLLAGLIFSGLLIKIIVGTLVAAALIAVTQGVAKSKSHA
ncbi:MAG: hypothetical protein LH469_12075 [Frankiaceae bacterium]|nr:hypothetical protein [Frankiaceae bacterium]